MNPEELLAIAKRALAAGEDSAAVDKAVRQVSGKSLAELEQSLAKPPATKGTDAILPLAAAAGMGATMGWLDELVGAMAAQGHVGQTPPVGSTFSERYAEGRESVRAPYERAQKDYPKASLAAELAGGLMVPIGGAVGSARGAGPIRALLRGLLTGAATGAVAGAGYAPTPGDIPGQAARGAVIGGPLGAAFPFGSAMGRQFVLGSGASRLQRAVAAEGGDAAVRAAAQKAVNLNRPQQPIAALGPYLRSEAEFAATRSPTVYAKHQPEIGQQRAGEAERLLSDVVDLTADPSVYGRTPARGQRAVALASGRPERAIPILEAARAEHFDPVFEAMAKSHKTILDKRLPEILTRPQVAQAFKGSVAEQMTAGTKPININQFRAIYTLWQEIDDAAGAAFDAGVGHKGAALRKAANDIEEILADNVPAFQAVRNAYRIAKKPVNIAELAGLETARKGRASPALDRASIGMRRELQKAFGSKAKYDHFMEQVAQEKALGNLEQQAFGGPATARRLLGTEPIGAEEVAEFATRSVGVKPIWAATSILGRLIPRGLRERAARQTAPLLFSPASEVDRVLAEIAAQAARQTAGPAATFGLPAYTGFLSGR